MMWLLWQSLKDKKWALLGWSLGAIFMAWLTIVFFPTIKSTGGFEQLTQNAPEQLKGLLGDTLSWTQIDHYISQQVMNFRLPMVTLIFAVMVGINLSVTEEDKGTLKTLQTLPIGRLKTVSAKWLTVVILSLVVAAACGVGVLVGVFSIHETVSMSRVLESSFLMWLLTASTASLTLMLGLATGKKGLTTLIASLFVAANILIPTLAVNIKDLEFAAKFTLYHYYEQPAIFINAIDWKHAAIMGAAAIAGLLIASFFYRNRDIAS